MIWQELLTAFALVLVLEGIMPFMNPAGLRRMMEMVSRVDDTTLRAVGLTSMVCGVLLLYVVH